MSKRQADWYSLPSLQRRIVLSLADKGPQTRNELSENVGSEWKNVRYALNSLKRKGIVTKLTKKKFYLGGEFPLYWLTVKGFFAAVKNGAKLEPLRENLKKTGEFTPLEKHEGLNLMFDLIKGIGQKNADKIYNMFEATTRGKIEITAVPTINGKHARQILKVVKKYPRYTKKLRRSLAQILRILQED